MSDEFTQSSPVGLIPIPRQLPAAVPDFTGRVSELNTLTRILDDASGTSAPGTLIISAIGGTAGIGKTALALHWAHQVAHRFPDGQFHVNLRGFDPSSAPMPPEDAIRGFLDALGVTPERIPRTAEAQGGLYRSILSDKRMLIVLDNARDEQQVRPLLPASRDSMVIVTSRNQIAGLAASEGARIISLDALTPDEAAQMLRSRLSDSQAAKDSGAISEIAALCAYLPLALSVAAARIAAQPRFSVRALAAELRDTGRRLDAFDIGDPKASVQAVFSWSYEQLSPEAARMFRLLGLHPGPDISVAAVASLADTNETEARRQLHELTHGCLITEHVPGRYTLHDLLRAYAARQARIIDGQPEITAARHRVLDYYAQAACASAILLYPSREMTTFAGQSEADWPKSDTHLKTVEQAGAWLEAEHSSLVAAVSLAVESGFDRHAWQLPWFLATHLGRRGYWNERITLLRIALSAAERAEDITGQAVSTRLLANAYMDHRDHDQSLDCYKASAHLYKQLGDRLGEAKAWQGVAAIDGYQGRYTDAVRHLEYVLQLQRELGHKAGEARTLISLGSARGVLFAIPETLRLCRQALTLAEEIDNRYIQQFAWHGIGYSEQVLGNFAEAVAGLRKTLDLAQKAGDRFFEADVFAHLGDLHHAHGKPTEAHEAWSQALIIFDEIHHPDADKVRSKLANPGPSRSCLFTDSMVAPHAASADRPTYIPWCSLLPLSTDDTKPTSDTVRLRRPAASPPAPETKTTSRNTP